MPDAIPKPAAIVKFGDCALDVRAGELHRAGARIRLQDKPLEFLILILEHHGELVTREDVRRRLWPNGTIVDFEHGINATVKRLREALHDNAEQPRYVETVPRRGYRFIAPIEIVARENGSPAAVRLQSPAPPGATPGDTQDAGLVPRAGHSDPVVSAPLADASARYTVLEAIGIGGQGRVFRGRDHVLERDVAIKFLPDWMAYDELALHRFRREAHATAALNHPNVLAVHDLAVLSGAACLVTEYLEGRTLRATIPPSGLPLHEVLGYALQTLDGLGAAHAKGIVHRDLKPENVFITREGRVKILDFGLAKAVAVSADPTAETTTAPPATTPGAVLGTMGYQSPEQARGEDVDARSDLFAFGTVLYEMLTGHHPFHRRSDAETIAAILRLDPPAPSSSGHGVPASCDAIIAKALEKDRELRYQSATEIKVDLLRVQRELSGRRSSGSARVGPLVFAMEQRLAPPGRRVAIGAGTALLALAAIAFLVFGGPTSLPKFQPVQLTQGTGVQSEPALSPDGQFVAYTSDENGTPDIYVMDRRNGSAIRRTDGGGGYRHAVWLADGGELLCVSSASTPPSIWRMPAFVGRRTLLLEDAADVSVSPDGQQIAFTRPSRSSSSGSLRIWVAPLADLNRARPVTGDNDGLWDHREPAFSPDGQSICYRAQMELWVVPAVGGQARRVLSEGQPVSTPAWSHDGRSLYFSSNREGTLAIWRFALGNALRDRLLFWRHPLPERVTLGTGSEQQPSLSRDGRYLVHSTLTHEEHLVFYDRVAAAEVAWDTRIKGSMPAFSPDGRRLYFAGNAGSATDQLYAVEIEDGKPRDGGQRLTNHPGHVSHPAVSPDGRWVAYYLVEKNQRTLWVVPAAGGSPSRITDGRVDTLPAWTPDGRSIVYCAEEGDLSHLEVVPVANGHRNGASVRLTSSPFSDEAPAVSPDGTLVAFRRASLDPRGRFDAWVVAPDGRGQARRVTTNADVYRLQWDTSKPGKLLVAGTWGGSTLEARVVDVSGRPEGGPGIRLAPLQDELVDFAPSADGRYLAFARLRQQGNIWLLHARSGSF